MEKIQSAIAKARAERQNTPTSRPAIRQRENEAYGDDDAAWAALPLTEPKMSRLRAQRIVTLDRGHEAASFDKLRTRMLQQMQVNGWRRVAITSPGPSSGKSTVALNLAYSLSRQISSRVLLCEMDLRKPSMAKILNIKSDRDFGNTLEQAVSFADEGLRLRSNLAIGALRRSLPNSAEILQNPRLQDTLDDIQATYDPTIMIFDMPPFKVSDDVMAFGDKVDCVLIVAAAEQTKMAELDICERELASVTNVLGVVLNKCRYEAADGDYSYYNQA